MNETETIITLVSEEAELTAKNNQIDQEARLNFDILPPTAFFDKMQGVEIEHEINEKDKLTEYTDEDGSVFLAECTKWIYPLDFNLPVRSPTDLKFITMQLYEDLGQLSAVLRKMNWHPSCKKELMRWVRKHGLSDDVKIARDGIIDESEEVVKEAVRANDVDTAKFVLKTAGKNRGWSEKEDSSSGGDVYAFINVGGDNKTDFSKLSDTDLTRILEENLKN